MPIEIAMSPRDLGIVRQILATCLPTDVAVWIFGARARGATRQAPDLDLAIDAGVALTYPQVAARADAFEESEAERLSFPWAARSPG